MSEGHEDAGQRERNTEQLPRYIGEHLPPSRASIGHTDREFKALPQNLHSGGGLLLPCLAYWFKNPGLQHISRSSISILALLGVELTRSGRQSLKTEAAAPADASAAALLVCGWQIIPRQLIFRDVTQAHQHALVLLQQTMHLFRHSGCSLAYAIGKIECICIHRWYNKHHVTARQLSARNNAWACPSATNPLGSLAQLAYSTKLERIARW